MIAALLLGLATVPGPTIPGTPAVDDGPCPEGTVAWMPEFDAGVDYDGTTNSWIVDGVVLGHSLQEDECIIPVDTKVQWTTGESHQAATAGEIVPVILYGSEAQCEAQGGNWWYEACELPVAGELPVTR